MIDFNDIIKAWWASTSPTPEESFLGEKRFEICSKCEMYKEVLKKKKWSAYCKACGCPVSKKVFSKTINPCPLDKWIDIDKRYGNGMDEKEQKTII
jgi:hypothetical protein